MPSGNGRGPAGMGPMTGRAAGYCAGYSVPGYMNPVSGRGFRGFGRGGGRGYRNRFYATGLPHWMRGPWGYPQAGFPVPPEAYGEAGYAGWGTSGYSKQDRLNNLEQHARHLEEMLSEIRKQIDSIKASKEAE